MKKKIFLLIVTCVLLLVYKNTNAKEIENIGTESSTKDVEIIKYIKTETLYDNTTKTVLDKKEIELTEEEYNRLDYMSEPLANCTSGVSCWETDYKKLVLRISQGSPSYGYGTITLTNEWKKAPVVKSYDIIAVTYNFSTIGYPNISAKYNNNTLSTSNNKVTYNGAGISVKLPDNMNNNDTIELKIVGTFGTNHPEYWNIAHICGTYQHAQSTVTLSDSLAYSFSEANGGVGGVLNFNSTTIKNKYDQMQGVCYN